MAIDELLSELEKYYGEYENKYLKGSVKAYILKDYKQDNYPEIRRSIQYFHKAIFKAPCIATIEECIKKARLEKGQVDPHKTKTTNTDRFNYRDSKDPAYDKVDVNLKDMLNKAVKKV